MLLAFDTATATASLALYDPTRQLLLAEFTWQARRRHTQDLLATAQQLLGQLELAPTQLTALAVTTGPGSFTGVRIAISVVKGLALGLPAGVPGAGTPAGVPVVGVPTLAVTAAPWLAVAAHAGATLCAYIQAGRGRYNWSSFAPGAPLHLPGVEDHAAGAAAEFAAFLGSHSGPLWLVGEPAPDLVEAVAELPHVCVVDAISGWRRAGHLAQVAAALLAAGISTGAAALQPLYLQSP
jgi:tRNA threonylcarbamoyladenosine biosynthesis protein TsaB